MQDSIFTTIEGLLFLQPIKGTDWIFFLIELFLTSKDAHHQNCSQAIFSKGMENVFFFRIQNQRKRQLLLCLVLVYFLANQKN